MTADVWYAKRNPFVPPRGSGKGTETIPSSDWDLSEIRYATSDDGFTWRERGVAVPRPSKPQAGWRSVSTPDVYFSQGSGKQQRQRAEKAAAKGPTK